MSLTTAGLVDEGQGQGVTAHYAISYDTSFLVPPSSNAPVANFLANVEKDFAQIQTWFEGVSFPFSTPIPVQVLPGGAASNGGSWPTGVNPPTVSLVPVQYYSAVSLRYLLVSEVTEMFMEGQNLGWFVPGGNEGSMGEGLSRFLGEQMLITNGFGTVPPTPSVIVPGWLNGARADYVDHDPDDNQPDQVTGCTLCFIWYLHSQLDHHIQTIIKAASFTNLSYVYQNLGNGPANTAWSTFIDLVDKHYPPFDSHGNPYVYHPVSDNIFPVSHLHSLAFPSHIVRGHSKTAEIHLDNPAMAEVRVFLTSSDHDCISVPDHVTFKAGDSSFSLTLTAASETLPYHSKDVTITAKYAGVTKTATISVGPPSITGFTATSQTLICGDSTSITVDLDHSSSEGPTPITFTSDNAALIAPSNQSIAQGDTSSSFFQIQSTEIAPGFLPKTVKVTATLKDSNSKSLEFQIVSPTVASMSFEPNPMPCGTSGSVTVYLTRACNFESDTVNIPVVWDPPGFAGVNPTLSVDNGFNQQTFECNAPDTLAPFAPNQAPLGATYAGTTVYEFLTIIPAEFNGVLSTVQLSPDPVVAGGLVTVLFTLNNAVSTDTLIGIQAEAYIPTPDGGSPPPAPVLNVQPSYTLMNGNPSGGFSFVAPAPIDGKEYVILIRGNAFQTAYDVTHVQGS